MRRRGRGRRVGTIIAMIGVLGVVGGSFGLGVFVGRHWSYFTVATGTLFSRRTPAPAREVSDERRRTETSEPMPNLTFYQDLTAPLATKRPEAHQASKRAATDSAAVRPDNPKRSAAAGEDGNRLDAVARSAAVGEAAARLDSPSLTAPPKLPGATEGPGDKATFNVQIAAYKTREQAETLRESLAARGVVAYVSEMSTPSGPRYRVRVGPFDSRDAAREKAIALAADTGLGAFVTTDAAAR